MQEHSVTVGNISHKVPEPFFVLATQNPIEQEGTYPLSEAQTDRFIVKEVITYPLAAEEVEILNRLESGVISRVDPAVLTIKDIDQVQDIVDKVYVDESIKWYISSIVVASRRASQIQGLEIGKYVRIGASPRASIAFLKMAKASALMHGRTYVTPDDVKMVRHQVLRHRIGLNYSAVADNVTVEQVIDGIVNSVKAP
jgi:MoxR-like ATPase